MSFLKKASLVILSTALVSAVAFADPTPGITDSNVATNAGLKIGVIDVAEILAKSPQSQAAAAQLKSSFQPRQEKIMTAQKTLTADQTQLKRDGAVMNQNDLQTLQNKINMEGRDLQQMQDDYVQDLRAAQTTAMKSILQKVGVVVQQLAEEQHYDLIIQKNVVPYSSQRADITPEVLAKLK